MKSNVAVDKTASAQSQDLVQYLTFQLSGEVYAVNIHHVREIIEFGDMTSVPMMPDFLVGVINLRGSVVPVIDLALRFRKEQAKITKRTSIVIIEHELEGQAIEIGMMVDLVNEVLEISTDNIEPSPRFGSKIRTDFIEGMGKIEDKFLILLNVDRILSIEELSMVEALSREA